MTSSTTASQTPRHHAPLARVLALVLLAFLAYTSTAESAHRHGGLALRQTTSSAPVVNRSDDPGSSAKDSRAASECPICQLRQHLSVSLLNSLPQFVAPQHRAVRALAAVPLRASSSTAPRRGRAPPTTSLS